MTLPFIGRPGACPLAIAAMLDDPNVAARWRQNKSALAQEPDLGRQHATIRKAALPNPTRFARFCGGFE
jgi:hypothetical protein